MDDSFTKRVGSAAAAGWWTVVVWAIWLTAAWLVWLWVLHARPGWVLTLWGGGDLGWSRVQSITLTFMAVAKLILMAAVLAALWLTLWARRLKRMRE